MTRRPITDLGLGITNDTIYFSAPSVSLENVLNTTFYNKINEQDKTLIVTKNTWNRKIYNDSIYGPFYASTYQSVQDSQVINTKPLKVFLPNVSDFTVSSTIFNDSIHSLFYIKTINSWDKLGFRILTLDWGFNNKKNLIYGADSGYNGSNIKTTMDNISSGCIGYFDSGLNTSMIYPKLYLSNTTQILTNDTNDMVVVGGSIQLSSFKGTTNKLYYYDRYLINPVLPGNWIPQNIPSNSPFLLKDISLGWNKQNVLSNLSDMAIKFGKYNAPFTYSEVFRANLPPYNPSIRTRINEKAHIVGVYGMKSTTGSDDNYYYSTTIYPWLYNGTVSFIKGIQTGSYFLGQDKLYPVNGYHMDGYWYIRKEEAMIEGLGEVTIDNISQDLKHDIMPLITVGLNESFERGAQGRGYISNPISVIRSDGKVNISAITTSGVKSGIKITGKFTTVGLKYIKEKDNTGKEIYLLFEVIDPSVLGSATAISF